MNARGEQSQNVVIHSKPIEVLKIIALRHSNDNSAYTLPQVGNIQNRVILHKTSVAAGKGKMRLVRCGINVIFIALVGWSLSWFLFVQLFHQETQSNNYKQPAPTNERSIADASAKYNHERRNHENFRINQPLTPHADGVAVSYETSMQAERNRTSRPNFAFAFVMGGCNPTRPSYRFFLYNIMVSTKILQEQGSVADVVVFVQMAWASNRTTLPAEEERWLQEMNIHVHYIKPVEDETFYRTVLHKFLILGLTEYERVILMDGDVMPTANLDYLFQMSLAGTLKENFIYQGLMEPSNAGFFMLKPDPTALDEIGAIIKRRAENARRLSFPYFDEVEGWGHVIQPPDQWESMTRNDTLWNFWCAFADQGLLYYWTKYFRKSVSILKPRGIVENWGPDPGTAYGVKLEARLQNPWQGIAPSQCWGKIKQCKFGPPYSHFVHFTGRGKPWWNPPEDLYDMSIGTAKRKRRKSAELIWFWHLIRLDEKFGMRLNFSSWPGKGPASRPLLGTNSIWEEAMRVESLDLFSEAPV